MKFLITLLLITKTMSFIYNSFDKHLVIGDEFNRLKPEVETKTILSQKNGFGFLSTLNRKSLIKGYPYGSIVGFCLDEVDKPFFIFSNLALHTRNILQNNSVSFCVTEYGFKRATDSRVSLTGNLIRKEDNENYYKKKFLKYHIDADWVFFPDFNVYSFDEIKSISFVGGFGKASRIRLKDYYSAIKDPFIDNIDEIIEYFNEHYYLWMLKYINKKFDPKIRTYYVKNIDAKGINIIYDKSKFIRFKFNYEVKTFEELKIAISEIFLE